ncbi:halo transducer protein [Haloferax mucosum ATCC BAA-1512]|uniref:Halo transducer protein n=1 Tax=Haloferax mucosum ATCC BAA-1512 TaxID=662479 RepID=M0IRN1_9EURY|nr:hypothetical protein [Haloferax mucosum]ELZ98124.1 halo transducer protein [Haloferax mucosum ATCC BAA-1512]
MGQTGSEHERDSIIGLSKDEATERLVAVDDAHDPATVRAVLDHVTEDDVVTRAGVDDAVTDTSMILSTAETRVELASIALSDARETAGDAAAIDAVRSRLETFESKVSTAADRIDELGSTVQTLSRWHAESRPVFDVVTGLRHAASEAQTLAARADDIQLNIEEFEHWISNHGVRVREFEADIDALEHALSDLEGSVETVTTDSDTADEADDSDDPTETDTNATAWFDATLRSHVLALLVADVRAELADLRELAARADADADDLETGAARLDELDSRLERLDTRLDEHACPAWTDEYGERIASFRDRLDAFEPPVSWGAVQSELEQYQPERDG